VRTLPVAAALLAACTPPLKAPATKTAPVIDRFSTQAGHLMVRSPDSPLPGPGEPIHFDRAPFQTQGFGPDGSVVRYDNFDTQTRTPAPRYQLARKGDTSTPDLVDVLPGDPGYNDVWQLQWVELPDGVDPASITSVADLLSRHYKITPTANLVDCPIVPPGSTAPGDDTLAPVAMTLTYRGAPVTCLEFGTPLSADDGRVPTSPIYVTFAHNPPDSSGFRTEAPTTVQTHNVLDSLPGDVAYSPLWDVHVYDGAAFDRVHDAQSALAAPLLVEHGPLVNCPVVAITHEPRP
jgi:hypothetical protein